MCTARIPRYKCGHCCLSETMWIICFDRIPKKQQKGVRALMADGGAWDYRRCSSPEISVWRCWEDCPGCKGWTVSRMAGDCIRYYRGRNGVAACW